MLYDLYLQVSKFLNTTIGMFWTLLSLNSVLAVQYSTNYEKYLAQVNANAIYITTMASTPNIC